MTRIAPSVPGLTYDSRRELVYAKPVWRGWMHLVGFEVSLVVGTLLVVHADGVIRVAAAAVYAATVSGLFGTSALYHRGNWEPAAHRQLQRLDHVMIYLLIAGTATPVFLLVTPGATGCWLLGVMWALTAIAMLTHLVWMSAPEVLVGGTFIGLGCVGGAALPFVWVRAGVAAFVLLLAGGLLYIAGAVLYHWRRPDPVPTVFGFHEVFHAFVSAAAGAHYVAIAILII
jgi:hemolysin III